MLLILAAANRQADPAHRATGCPLPNRLLATAPFVTLGAMAYSLYLWHWPLLIFWLSYTGHSHASISSRAPASCCVSGVLAWLTTRYVENPLRYRASASAPRPRPLTVPLRTRLRRPTIVLGSIVALLGVALTATSFTWREHVTVAARRTAKNWPAFRRATTRAPTRSGSSAKVPKLPMRPRCWRPRTICPRPPPTAASATSTTSTSSTARSATSRRPAPSRWPAARTPSTGSPRWICWASMHHFKVVTYLKMGCPLTTEKLPLVMGDNRPYPECHEWNAEVMPKLIADHPDYVFTTSTRPWNIKPGDVMPATYIGIWQTFVRQQHSDPGDARHAVAGAQTASRSSRRTAWPTAATRSPAGSSDPTYCRDHNPTLDFVAQFPLLKPLDMSDAVCRKDICRAVEGNVLIYRDAHHISTTYMRTMTGRTRTSDRRRHRLVGWLMAVRRDRRRYPPSGRVTPIRSAPPTTARERTSRCSPRSPSGSSCA